MTPQDLLDFARSKRVAPPLLAIATVLVYTLAWVCDLWQTDHLGFRYSATWAGGGLTGWSLCRWSSLRAMHRDVIRELEKAVARG